MDGNGHVKLLGFDHPDLAQEYDLNEIRQQAREAGIDLSLPSVQTAIAKRRQAALENEQHEPPRVYVLFQNAIIGVGHAITTAVMLIISHVLLPLSIIGLAVAEYARVKAGIKTFDSARATLLSGVAVVFYLGLLVVYSNKIDGAEITRDKFSLRLLWRKLRYFVGLGGKFRTQQITSLDLLEQALKWTGALIVLLGTVGSLKGKLAIEGAWHSAIVHLLVDSDLPTFLSLIGGLTLTAGLLFGLRFLVDYQWQTYRKLLPEGASFFGLSGESSESADLAEMEYLLNRIRQKQQNT